MRCRMRLCDLDKLKKSLSSKDLIRWTHEYGDVIPLAWIMSTIDNTPELGYEDGILSVETATRRSIELEEAYNNGWSDGFSEGEDENKRPQGKWEYVQYDGNADIGNWHCSECGRIVYLLTKTGKKPYYNFCPNCGADMRGAE